MTIFNKSEQFFPVRREFRYFNNCGVAAQYGPAAQKAAMVQTQHSYRGCDYLFGIYEDTLTAFRQQTAQLLGTSPQNITAVPNTAFGLNLIAGGYPFEATDEVVSYCREYPSNHYPWKLQTERGVRLVLLRDDPEIATPHDLTTTWSFSELERKVSPKTRVIALSYVQFPSGMGCDLQRIGDFCQAHDIDFVLDAAQGLGALPLNPEEMGIAAVVSSGWKWLLGPVGTGVLYTSPALRDKLKITMAGGDMMQQGHEYLDHQWAPHDDGRRFEFSTQNIAGIAALSCAIEEVAVRYGPQAIRREIFRLQDLATASLNRDLFFFHQRPDWQRSGILSLVPLKTTPAALVAALAEEQIICSERDGYLRVAPHVYNTDDDMVCLVEALNRHGVG